MPIVIKSQFEIEKMRRAGRLGHDILHRMAAAVRPGTSTEQLDNIAQEELARAGARTGAKNYPTYQSGQGYPKDTCISVNEVIVHGVPGRLALREGDIVTLDIAPWIDGYYCDCAITVPVGQIHPRVQKLLEVTLQTLNLAIQNMRPGRRWSDIARLMQYNVE